MNKGHGALVHTIEGTIDKITLARFANPKAGRWRAGGAVKGHPGQFADFDGRGSKCPIRPGDHFLVVVTRPSKRKKTKKERAADKFVRDNLIRR